MILFVLREGLGCADRAERLIYQELHGQVDQFPFSRRKRVGIMVVLGKPVIIEQQLALWLGLALASASS